MPDNKSHTKSKKPVLVLGVMSGTSLDGVDLALCRFTGARYFEIKKAATVAYPRVLHNKLQNAMQLTGNELTQLHTELGAYYAKIILAFLKKNKLTAHFIASHGHTIFHQPQKKYTLQIGCGATMSALTGIAVINNFRQADVMLGGQGAPLVPIGDELWFSQYTACLNLGGISNISYKKGKQRIAFDIGVCNMALNDLANQFGKPYDKNGLLAQKGNIDAGILYALNALPYLSTKPPKSLGREWYEKSFKPLLRGNTHDLLRTVTEHIAVQIAVSTQHLTGSMLVTGGGAHNRFLMDRIKQLSPMKIWVPEPTLINFKEAAVFALMGYLRSLEQPNILAAVTGASRNHCAGELHLP